jgi:dTDP-4-dehydrorhamnose reductase
MHLQSVNRLLVIGGTGLLGQYLVLEGNAQGWDVIATYHDHDAQIGNKNLVHLDVRDEDEVRRTINELRPQLVILAGGMTDLDECETHPQEAWAVNAEGTLNVAATCKLASVPLMYISTDAVFSGQNTEPYYEFDSPDPLGIYAQTKLEGERLTLDADHRNMVCRVSTLYGWNRVTDKKNLVTWVVSELRAGRPVDLHADRRSNPTYAPHCAKALLTMFEKGGRGLYHASGRECFDRYEVGLKIAEAFGLDPSLCRKASSDDLPRPAPRGKYLCLNVQKAEGEFDMRMLPLADGGRLSAGDFFALAPAPRKVVLSGCDAARSTGGAEDLGLAQALVAAGAEEVLAPIRPVSDVLAEKLATALYGGGSASDAVCDLAGAGTLAVAARDALKRVREQDPTSDWQAFRVLAR